MFSSIVKRFPRSIVVNQTRFSPRLFSTQINPFTPSYSISYIHGVFADIRKKLIHEGANDDVLTDLALKEIDITDHCKDALKHHEQPSRLARLDAAIPNEWSLEKKTLHACEQRKRNFVEFALTGHPTELRSAHIRKVRNQISKWVLKLGTCEPSSAEALVLKRSIKQTIQAEYTHSWLQEENLTPDEEGICAENLYLEMMESWPQFNRRNIQQFLDTHKVTSPEDIAYVTRMLTEANKYSYQNGWSWFLADIDGNFKKTAQTMARMIPGLQTAILNWYMSKIEPLLSSVPELQSTYDYMRRCKETIGFKIYFNDKKAMDAQVRLLAKLDKFISTTNQNNEIGVALQELRDLVDIVGFKGHLKQHLRQSSKVIEAVFDEFFQILDLHHPEINEILLGRRYTKLALSEKESVQQYLRSDAKYFDTLKRCTDQFSMATKREVDVFAFVWKHSEQFGCIISDTKNTNSMIEAIHLLAISAHIKLVLFIDEVKECPVELTPLCETASDLKNLPTIINAMLADPYLKKGMIERKRITYLAGPSDIGSKEGEFKHHDLVWREAEIEKILLAKQKHDPELAEVKLRVFHGSGNDIERQISTRNLFRTYQGDGASALAEPGAFAALVADLAGHSSENSLRAQEFALFEKKHPAEAARLKSIIEKSVIRYHDYHDHPVTQALTQRLSVPRLGSWFNRSSRDDSAKGGADVETGIVAEPDISKARAIGKVNFNRAMLFLIRRFLSADVLLDLSPEDCRDLPLLYAELTTFREYISKMITSIAVTDFHRAWCKINDGVVPPPSQIIHWAKEYSDPSVKREFHHIVAYGHYHADLLLRRMATAFYEPDRKQAQLYFAAIEPLSKLPNHLALGLLKEGVITKEMKHMGCVIQYDLLPRYELQKKCLDRYQNDPHPPEIAKKNVVMALRMNRPTSTWKEIADIRSWLSELPLDTLGLEPEEVEDNIVRVVARC